MPTEAHNAEERIARIEAMVAGLAAVEQNARKLAADVRMKADALAAERRARSEHIAELERLEKNANQIAADVAASAARITAELAALKLATLKA